MYRVGLGAEGTVSSFLNTDRHEYVSKVFMQRAAHLGNVKNMAEMIPEKITAHQTGLVNFVCAFNSAVRILGNLRAKGEKIITNKIRYFLLEKMYHHHCNTPRGRGLSRVLVVT